jgi:sugar/nucleoside kinase (ribokinase family)
MNYWIESARDSLIKTIGCVDVIVFNDAEVRMLTGEPNLSKAAKQIRELGPKVLLVKQGAYGACMFTKSGFFSIPAYPLETVNDPTGAGDAFAGGYFGFLDSLGTAEFADNELRCAAVYGSVMASFVVEDFGSERLQRLTQQEIADRFEDFKQMTVFEGKPVLARIRA